MSVQGLIQELMTTDLNNPNFHAAINWFVSSTIEQATLDWLRFLTDGLQTYFQVYGKKAAQDILRRTCEALRGTPTEEKNLRDILTKALELDKTNFQVASFLAMGLAQLIDDIRKDERRKGPESEKAIRSIICGIWYNTTAPTEEPEPQEDQDDKKN